MVLRGDLLREGLLNSFTSIWQYKQTIIVLEGIQNKNIVHKLVMGHRPTTPYYNLNRELAIRVKYGIKYKEVKRIPVYSHMAKEMMVA